jgi:hypothetical protein
MSAFLVLPNPFSRYQIVDALRDLVYLNPVGVDEDAVQELLSVLDEGVFKRTWRDTFQRSVVGKTAKDEALVQRLAAAETKLAASLAARRASIQRAKPVRRGLRHRDET